MSTLEVVDVDGFTHARLFIAAGPRPVDGGLTDLLSLTGGPKAASSLKFQQPADNDGSMIATTVELIIRTAMRMGVIHGSRDHYVRSVRRVNRCD